MYLNFNNKDLTQYLTITKYNINLLPAIDKNKFSNRVLTIEYVLNDLEESQIDELASILDTSFNYADLYFNSTTYLYKAVVTSTSLNHITKRFKAGSLEFNLLDNFRIKKAKTKHEYTDVLNEINLNYAGTARTFPFFEILFKDDTSYLQILNKQRNSSLKLGAITQLEQINLNTETILENTEVFSGFTYNNLVLATKDGKSQGTVKLTENGLTVDDYYNFATNQFYGANYSKVYDVSQNFKVKTYIEFSTLDLNNTKNNRLEFTVSDEQNDLLATIQITSANNQNINSIVFKTALSEISVASEQTDTSKITENIEFLGKWNNFKGYFEILKFGDDVTFRVTKLNNENEVVATVTETLSSPVYKSKKLKRVGFWMAKFRENDVLENMYIKNLEVIKYSSDSTLSKNLFKEGSVLKIDCENSKVVLDNIERYDIIDISNNFFDLKKGVNDLLVLSDSKEGLDITIKYNEKYMF